MENKFKGILYNGEVIGMDRFNEIAIKEDEILTLVWNDGVKLEFPNQLSYFIFENFMIESNFEKTREELTDLTDEFHKLLSENLVDGKLDETFSFKENIIKLLNK